STHSSFTSSVPTRYLHSFPTRRSSDLIRLTTINRSSKPYRSTSSYVASYCTSFRKASCAFDISAFWPTAGAPSFCRFALSCWARDHSRKRNTTLPPPKRLLVFIAAPTVEDQ